MPMVLIIEDMIFFSDNITDANVYSLSSNNIRTSVIFYRLGSVLLPN